MRFFASRTRFLTAGLYVNQYIQADLPVNAFRNAPVWLFHESTDYKGHSGGSL